MKLWNMLEFFYIRNCISNYCFIFCSTLHDSIWELKCVHVHVPHKHKDYYSCKLVYYNQLNSLQTFQIYIFKYNVFCMTTSIISGVELCCV